MVSRIIMVAGDACLHLVLPT